MTQVVEAPSRSANLPAIGGPRLPFHPLVESRFGIDKASWKALVEAIFPNAQSTESVILALSYCRARKLDPFKRNVHIVPIWDRNQGCLVDTVWPGIGELRTTAFRTGDYAGRDDALFGEDLTQKVGNLEITFPKWCQVTVYRVVKGQRVAFSGPKVYWLETYATVKRNDDTPNEMWASRVYGQIEKCAEAAALRAAFPEEIGSDYIAEEIRSSPPTVKVVGEAPERGSAALLKQLQHTEALGDDAPRDDASITTGDPSSPDSAIAPAVDATDETVDAGVSEAHEESAQQPEAPGADAPQAPTSAELATWDKFRTWGCNHYAKHHRIEHVDAATALAKWAAQNLIAKDPKKGLEARTALSVLILENGLDLATGEIKG
jgi:phage recombination protein Bet